MSSDELISNAAAQLCAAVTRSREAARDSRQPMKKLDTATKSFVPLDGVSCIMAVVRETFANEVFAALKDEKQVDEAMVLLPPRSWHVTLTGLEHTMGDNEEQQARHFLAVERTAAILFADDNPIRFVPAEHVCSSPTASLVLLNTLSERDEEALRHLERTCLGAEKSFKPQEWHITLGYFLDRHAVEGNRAAHARVLEIFQSALRSKTGEPGCLECGLPRVCTYTSMAEFYPIFPRQA
ncbi:hypothetical protein FVE85_0944 [Porphyridium purpureum]|uniref:Cyclic phosphodiesterase n=1 Tax=Porphyridium purpureum TaxID=35688 RepID=A0A5J4Z1J4_PORPP|nr:hypothetical protein FVE85_0944 [Porphyridium purpureum]|eukprot:POR9827..scf208_2